MTVVHDAIRTFVQAHRTQSEAFLRELVRVPSDNPPGDCAPHARRTAELLAAMGLPVSQLEVPAESVARNGMVSCINLVVRVVFGDGHGPVVALNAHGDVVPPGEGWSSDPYGAEIRDGCMYGRGVAVSKSDFATYAFALRALQDAAAAGALLDGTVELHLTYDEEVGGAIGPAWLLAQGHVRPDYAISAGFAYGITTAHNGCLHLEVEVRGRSGHAAEPEKGVDALEAATRVLSELYASRERYAHRNSQVPGIAHPTLVIGLIEGGINTNVVPDRVVFRLDRRIIPEESPAQAEEEVRRDIIEAAQRCAGISVDIRRLLLAAPLQPIAGYERLVDALQRGASLAGHEPLRVHGVPIYTDARHYAAAGVPAVLYGAGPRTLAEANGHRADENLRIEDLHRATEVVALALAELLQARKP